MGTTEKPASEELSPADTDGRPESGLRRKLYIIIFETETKLGRWFDILLLWAILISIVEVILESDKGIQEYMGASAFYIEWVITIFFTVEYVLRLYVSRKPMKYAKSFFGVIDLLAIIPSYITFIFPGGQYFMVVRVLRLMRVFRILKLARFSKAASVLGTAVLASRYKIAIFLGVVISLVLILGTCMHIVEGDQVGFSSIPKSMYWAIVTMTTVGYGDTVPVTTVGKLVASMMMLIGYAIIAVPTGIVTNELAEASRNNELDSNCSRCREVCLQESNYCHKCGEKLRNS